MVAAYLYLNAVLYIVFAAWCTLRWRETSKALGYVTLSHSGQSEYLVLYGGVQLALAVAFFLVAREPSLHGFGLTFALALYAAIVAYRIPTAIAFSPVSSTTWIVAGLELFLLVAAAALWFAAR